MTVVFDKLSFMRHLESDGTFSRPQAERLSEAFHQAVQETVATKADIVRLESRIDTMDARIDAKLAGIDAKLGGLDVQLAGVDGKMVGFDAKFGRLEARLDAVIASNRVWTVGVGVALFSALAAIRFFGH